MNRSTFWMIKYMNGSVFSKARYMNGVGFEILARTPVPILPLSYPPPRPPSPEVRRIVWKHPNDYISRHHFVVLCFFYAFKFSFYFQAN